MNTNQLFQQEPEYVSLSQDETLEAVEVLKERKQNREADKAITKLTKQFYPYILKTALQVSPNAPEDSIMAGIEGLIYAAQNYDKNTGTKFITYAFLCIYGYIHRDKRDSRIIKISNDKMNDLKNNLDDAKKGIELKNITSHLSLNNFINRESESSGNEFSDFLVAPENEGQIIDDLYYQPIYKRMKEIIFDNRNPEDKLYSTLYCHIKGLFDYDYISFKDAVKNYNLNEKKLRDKCKNIDSRLRRDTILKDLIRDDERKKKKHKRDNSIWAHPKNAYIVDSKNQQMYFILT